jgi:guanylate kinase
MPALLERLRGRASEDEDTVQRRFEVARDEIAHYGLFDYVIVNEELDRAQTELVAIFRAEECRRHRASRHAERLLAETRGFGGSVPPGSKEP